jgi:dehydrogenase/reductase SDR family protein 1
MAGDCGTELRRHNVAMISLWPGPVQTEEVMSKIASGKGLGGSPEMTQLFKEGETTEFPGICIVSLARDDGVMAKTGKVRAGWGRRVPRPPLL